MGGKCITSIIGIDDRERRRVKVEKKQNHKDVGKWTDLPKYWLCLSRQPELLGEDPSNIFPSANSEVVLEDGCWSRACGLYVLNNLEAHSTPEDQQVMGDWLHGQAGLGD